MQGEQLGHLVGVGSRRRKFWHLVADGVAYRVGRMILNRAVNGGIFTSPMVVPVRDLIGQRIIATGSFELTQFDAVDQLLADPLSLIGFAPDFKGVFIDVGANIGLYTTRYAPYFATTLAIEANPATFFALKANVEMARSPRVTSICVAASNSRGTAKLNVAESGMLGWSRLAQDAVWPTYSVDIQTDTLENIVLERGEQQRVALIKIDVEGHELEVLQGAANIIARDGPVLLFEALSGEAGLSSMNILQVAGYDHFFTFSRQISVKNLLAGFPVVAQRIDPKNPSINAMICALRKGTA